MFPGATDKSPRHARRDCWSSILMHLDRGTSTPQRSHFRFGLRGYRSGRVEVSVFAFNNESKDWLRNRCCKTERGAFGSGDNASFESALSKRSPIWRRGTRDWCSTLACRKGNSTRQVAPTSDLRERLLERNFIGIMMHCRPAAAPAFGGAKESSTWLISCGASLTEEGSMSHMDRGTSPEEFTVAIETRKMMD